MAIRVRYKITVSVSSSSLEEKDLADQTWEVVTDGLNEGGTMKVVVPASTSLLQIQLPVVSPAAVVAIRINSQDPTLAPASLDFRRNTTVGEVITLTPQPGAKEAHMLLSTTGLTALYVTNSSTTVMEVTLTIAA